MPGQSVEISSVTEAEETKIVKVKSQRHVDHVLRCEGHRPQRVPATNDQSASLQGDPTAYASLGTREGTRFCGRTNRGCFTLTMHQLTTPRAFDNFWP